MAVANNLFLWKLSIQNHNTDSPFPQKHQHKSDPAEKRKIKPTSKKDRSEITTSNAAQYKPSIVSTNLSRRHGEPGGSIACPKKHSEDLFLLVASL